MYRFGEAAGAILLVGMKLPVTFVTPPARHGAVSCPSAAAGAQTGPPSRRCAVAGALCLARAIAPFRRGRIVGASVMDRGGSSPVRCIYGEETGAATNGIAAGGNGAAAPQSFKLCYRAVRKLRTRWRRICPRILTTRRNVEAVVRA